ncbi:universal stress protein [Streptomyces sp. NPDC058964]|uniref:universal stress protein n=1 Tax=Streptomyces sp. NPDC058964 TaxID=3346681 RepID=UPI0036B7C9F6
MSVGGAGGGGVVVGGGRRGGGRFTRALLGSVSQHVSHHANCPVVIVRTRTSS